MIIVAEKCEEKSELNFAYNTQDSVKQKIFDIAHKIYGAGKINVEIRSGAGFLVVLLGDMMLMPALGKSPAALNMKIDENEQISGLF
ncbi:MAG: formate--tetrahydrofolate ligase [Christensenellales bacterium]